MGIVAPVARSGPPSAPGSDAGTSDGRQTTLGTSSGAGTRYRYSKRESRTREYATSIADPKSRARSPALSGPRELGLADDLVDHERREIGRAHV